MLVIIFLLLITHYSLLSPSYSQAVSIPKSISISALIGSKVTIYGYSSPNSKIDLIASNAQATTYSNKFGYWQFYRIYLPSITSEICFYLTDDTSLTAPPTCIPNPPPNDFTSNIGPIILPPTIAINSDEISPNSTVASSGQSIPNTPIQIHFFTQQQNTTFPKTANAYSLPSLDVLTDKDGLFNFNLPTAYSTSYKFFASNHHPDLGPSPISHTLNLSLPSFWQLYKFILIPLILLFLTLLTFLYLLLFKSKKKRYLPAFYPKSLTITVCPVK